MNLDHVVLWVTDPLASLDFYCTMLGMTAVRAEEFKNNDAPFPSVRINDESILDLMDVKMLEAARGMTGGEAGGNPINHLCLNLSEEDYQNACHRLEQAGIRVNPGPRSSFGAQGYTPYSVYFNDMDNNIIELRRYA